MCVCTVNAISSAFIPDSIAKPNSEIISDAPVPTTCAPISVSSSLSVINLTKPFVSSNDKARPLAAYGNLEALIDKPSSLLELQYNQLVLIL